ncbi:MAG TPA: cytidine deaminase, partial [Spirochaetaceae bacterium]|nr:cytidine deaminase [Spirochaetaceae bacterium]
FPCNECAKAIIQSGIRRVVYQSEKGNEKFEIASRRMFEASGVEMVRLDHTVGLKLTVDGSAK